MERLPASTAEELYSSRVKKGDMVSFFENPVLVDAERAVVEGAFASELLARLAVVTAQAEGLPI
jgi:hypothetical protein